MDSQVLGTEKRCGVLSEEDENKKEDTITIDLNIVSDPSDTAVNEAMLLTPSKMGEQMALPISILQGKEMISYDEESIAIKIAKTFSLASTDSKEGSKLDPDCQIVDEGNELQNDYFLTNLEMCDGDDHNAPCSNETDIMSQKAHRRLAKTLQTETSIEKFPASSDSKEILHDKIGLHIIDLDNYDQSKIFSHHECDQNNVNTSFADIDQGSSFFSADIEVISSDSQIDFLAEKAPKVAITSKSSHCSDHSYYNPKSQNCFSAEVTDDQGQLSTNAENSHLTSDLEDFQSGYFENMEFSTIFSSLDDYQHCLGESNLLHNESISQVDSLGDSNPNFIADLGNQIFSDSGEFGLSLTQTESNTAHTSDEITYDSFPQFSHSSEYEDMLDKNQTSIKTETDKTSGAASRSCMIPNVSTSGDINGIFLPPTSLTKQQHCMSQDSNTSAQTGATLNAVNQPFTHNIFDRSLSGSSVYDPYVSEYYGKFNNQDNYHYQGPQGCLSTPYLEWSSWTSGSEVCDTHPDTKPFREALETNVWSSARDEVTTPEIVQFLQMEAKEDEEETDDADEFEDMSMSLSQSIHDSGPGSVATNSYYSDDGSSVITSYSPAALTPPPSASSTPIPPSIHESHSSEEMGFFSPWPPSSCTDKNKMVGPSSLHIPPCKLSTEQLESELLSFGLRQGMKHHFPSMADAMRSTRSCSRSTSSKKFVTDGEYQVSKRCGRPRKNQIQSDKISTSTAKSVKGKKKSVSKTKGEECSNDLNSSMDETADEPGSSGGQTKGARHNEPLNQHAIEIMTMWFEEHVHNPYPSKADKEEMARQGGITENQVKSWFANKRNRTNNTKPKVQKRAMEAKLKELFKDLKRNHRNPMADNTHIIQQLSGIIQHCHTTKTE